MNSKLSIVILFTLFLISSLKAETGKKQDLNFDQTYRPQIHFSVISNRLGAPVSLIQSGEKQFLFYQHNSNNLQNGYYNLAYATSDNGIQWEHQSIAIAASENSIDSIENNPRFATVLQEGEKLEAIYNRWNKGLFTKEIDAKKNTNEELISQKEEFLQAEPFVFKYEAKNIWVMVSFNKTTSKIEIYNSNDKINWTLKSSFVYGFGYPSLYQLNVDQKPNEKKWVLISDEATYMVGDFDGSNFAPFTSIQKFDYGKSLGGSVCKTSADQNSLLVYTEMKHPENSELSFSGMLSFPSNLVLHEEEDQFFLYKQPVKEIETLFDKTYSWEKTKIYPGIKNNVLSRLRGDCYYIEGVIDIATCNIFGFGIRGTRNEIGSEISYVNAKKVFSALGTGLNYDPINNKIEFKIIIDRSSIEIYLDEGKYAISSTFMPNPEGKFYELMTRGGEIIIDKMSVHRLNSIWKK